MNEPREPRTRPTEIANSIVERFVTNRLGTPLNIPAGLLWTLRISIADAIRRERVVIFNLRDAADLAADFLTANAAQVEDPATGQEIFGRLRTAVASSQAGEDRELPRFNAPLFEHVGSARVACLEVVSLTPGRLTFRFEDNYSGKPFFLAFDSASEVLCSATLEGASAEQLGAMVAFALGELRKRKESEA